MQSHKQEEDFNRALPTYDIRGINENAVLLLFETKRGGSKGGRGNQLQEPGAFLYLPGEVIRVECKASD